MKVTFNLKNNITNKYGSASIDASCISQVNELQTNLQNLNFKIIGTFPEDPITWEEWQKNQN